MEILTRIEVGASCLSMKTEQFGRTEADLVDQPSQRLSNSVPRGSQRSIRVATQELRGERRKKTMRAQRQFEMIDGH